ncbi:hypothetical protein TRVL_08975 [Trypanosoma vivax]|nr:hypothetical protein TRVL_08975 [Trypanosoma vivax]
MHVSSGAGALVHPKEGWREKVVLGAGSLACSYRAECVAMEAGLKRLVDVIGLNKTHTTRAVAFTDSLSLLMELSTGPAVVEGDFGTNSDLILRIVRLRVSVNFRFVFSHCGAPRNEAADKAAEQSNVKPQWHPAWATDIVAGVKGKVRNEMYRVFEEGRSATHASQCATRSRSVGAEAHQAGSSGRVAAGTVQNRHLEAFRVATQSVRTQDGPAGVQMVQHAGRFE